MINKILRLIDELKVKAIIMLMKVVGLLFKVYYMFTGEL